MRMIARRDSRGSRRKIESAAPEVNVAWEALDAVEPARSLPTVPDRWLMLLGALLEGVIVVPDLAGEVIELTEPGLAIVCALERSVD